MDTTLAVVIITLAMIIAVLIMFSQYNKSFPIHSSRKSNK